MDTSSLDSLKVSNRSETSSENGAENAQARAEEHVGVEEEEGQPNEVDHEAAEIGDHDWASLERR